MKHQRKEGFLKLIFKTSFILFFLPFCSHKKNFLIKINKSGGFAGFHEEFILEDHNVVYRDKKRNLEISSKIPKDKKKIIKEVMENVKEGDFGAPYPDCIVYEIILNEKEKFKKITYIPGPKTKKEDLDKLIEILNEIIFKMKKE